MRIVGEIPHPRLKITLFEHNEKFAVKFETGLLEQTYKFRQNAAINSIEEFKKFLDQSFITKAEQMFTPMMENKSSSLRRNLPIREDEFDEII